MRTETNPLQQSPKLNDLQQLFRKIKPPYGPDDIVRFNMLFMRLYNQLGREEKRRAQEFMDALIKGDADEKLAIRVFGRKLGTADRH